MPAASTLVDNFDDNSKNTGLWVDPVSSLPLYIPAFSGVGGTIAETGGKLNLTGAVSQADRGNGYISVATDYDLRDSFFRLDLDTAPTGAGGGNHMLVFAIAKNGTSSENAKFEIENNFGTVTLRCVSNSFGNAGDGGTVSLTFDSVNHRRLRFRFDTAVAGGTLYWETAPLGSDTWTVRRSMPAADSGFWLPDSVQTAVAVVQINSNASPLTWIVDSFNSSAAPAAPVLSAPTPSGTLGTLNTATVGATTDQNTGTLYVVVDTVANLAGVTATQIKAGQRASGAAAFQAGNSAVSTTSPSVAISGLAAGTLYGYAIVQNNTNGDSNIVTGSFTTASTVVPVITDAGDEIFLDGETGTLIGSGFLASQGAGAVFLSPTNNVNDPNRRSLTVNSWSATSINVTFSKGALNYLTGLFLFVVNNQGASNATGYSVQLEPRVYIRDDFINLQSNPRASETGLRVLVWRALPTLAAPNPSQVLENQTLDAGGNSNWQIARGSLAIGDPIWFAVLRDGATPIATMRKFTPTYE